MSTPLGVLAIRSADDIRTVRRRAGEIAALIDFDSMDQVRISTAVSEIARNALQHGSGGSAEFLLNAPMGAYTIRISDRGPGIGDLKKVLRRQLRGHGADGFGIAGAQRLMDELAVEDAPTGGCTVTLSKRLPHAGAWTPERLAQLQTEAAKTAPADELRREDELRLRLMEELRTQREEAARLGAELEDTNRGVLALYAELDEKAERLRRADQMKSRFLSHMSHEFRTPLTSIMALSRLLLDEIDGRLTGEQSKQVTFIRKSAESLLEMVNDLLDLARVEAGKSVVRTSRFEIANLFGALRSLLRPLQVNSAVELIFEDASSLPPLETDEAKVTQILRNFISNALKFTESGEVRVAARLDAAESTVLFSVADTGIGIDAQQLGLIFRDFSQLENPLQNKWKGTGLGLSLSKGLAEVLGGSVRVESTPGKGSTFYAEIPLVHAQAGLEPAPTNAPPDVLVIDDEEVSRYVTRQALGAGVCICEAADGENGIALARLRHPRSIVLDLVMQPMDGFQVLERLKSEPATRGIPVIVLTSKTLSPGERDILGSRVAACFSKEILSHSEGGERLRSALGIRGYSRQQTH